MKVSVLIPSHHDSSVLQKCIDSISTAAQRCPSADIEIVVIAHNQTYEDITTTDIPLHIYSVKDPEKEVSIGELRNMAIAKATKEYVLFVDADDLLTEKAFTSFQRELSVETPPLVISATSAFFSDGSTFSNALMYSFCTNVLIKRDIIPSDVFPHWSMYEDNMFRSWVEQTIPPARLVYIRDVTYRYLGHAGKEGVRTGARFSTPEECLSQFLSFCQWAVKGGLKDSDDLIRLAPVVDLLLDYFTKVGQDFEYIEKYKESVRIRRHRIGQNTLPLAKNTEKGPLLICDDPIDGGEYIHDVKHRKVHIGNKIQLATFILTTKCNKSCSYCWQKSLPSTYLCDDRSEEQIYKDFCRSYYALRERYTCLIPALMGGEITLLSDELATKILKTITEHVIYVYSNGANTDSPFYKDDRCVVTRHIVDWESKPSIIPVNEREVFSIQVLHDKVDELIRYIQQDFPSELLPRLQIAPTRAKNASVSTQLEDIRRIQEEVGHQFFPAEALDPRRINHFQDKCRLLEASPYQVFCKENEYSSCCAGEYSPRSSLSAFEEPTEHSCHDCLGYLYTLQRVDISPFFEKENK